MKGLNRKKRIWSFTPAFLIFGLAVTVVAAYAHGGKNHGPAGEFTNLEALKKATVLYDKLVAADKLEVTWETTVDKVQIAERRKGADIEKVVSFTRSAGEPKTVYIFFTSRGEYAGSNFTGQ
jgi:hypothetical protein